MQRLKPLLFASLFAAVVISFIPSVERNPEPSKSVQPATAQPHPARLAASVAPAVLPAATPVVTAELVPVEPARTLSRTLASSRPVYRVRVQAIRDGKDYGWVELPRGAKVDLVREEGKTVIVGFSDCFVRVPRWIIEDGTVTLRSRRA